MTTNLIRKQRAADFSTAMLLFYGLPGAGKTTLGCSAGTEENRLILDCEGGVKAQVGDVAPIDSLKAFNIILDFLEKGQHQYEYIVLDGLDALYQSIFEQSHFGKNAKDKRQAHIEPSQHMAQALRRFAALPVVKIVIAHAKFDTDAQGRSNIMINMPPSLRLQTEGLVDVGMYCWRGRSGSYMFVADAIENERGSSWGKDRSGKLGAKGRRQDWAAIQQALNL